MAWLGATGNASGAAYTPGDLWWNGTKDSAHERLLPLVDYLLSTPEESTRRASLVESARLYGNKYFVGFGPFQFGKPAPRQREDERLRANVIKPVVNTAAALIAGRNRPKATFVTNGGDWAQKRRAKKADRFIEGAFRDVRLAAQAPLAFRNALIFGTGVLKFYTEFGRIRCENVLPTEILVDPVDGMYGSPRCIYQIKYIDRRVLLARFGRRSPSLKKAILECDIANDAATAVDRTTTAEPIRVVESWHLASGPEEKDGRHCIAIATATLCYEDWSGERFPFVFFRWEHAVVGFWGVGIVESLKPIQLDVNITLRRIKECLHLMAVPRIFVQQTAKVIKSLITNEVGAIIPYAGAQPPTFLTPPSVPQELFVHLRWLIQQAFEQEGVSQMSATSQKPAGLNSGEAIRQYNDLGSDRFSLVSREYEDAHMTAAKIMMDLAAELDESGDGDGYSTVYIRGRAASGERIKWADVRMDAADYTLQVHPTSMLPRDVAGRTATVQEWIATGFVDLKQGKRLLDFPDLDAENDLTQAGQDRVDQKIDLMLDSEDVEYIGPRPFEDLQYAFARVQLTIEQAEMDNAPEERLDLLRQYLTDTESLLKAAEEAAAMKAANAAPQAAQMQPPPAMDMAA